MNKLLSSLPSLDTHKLILGGNFNMVVNPVLDRSSPKQIARPLSYFMEDNGYIDPWRFSNPSSKSFSFFCRVHCSYSQIDYFFLDRNLLNHVYFTD